MIAFKRAALVVVLALTALTVSAGPASAHTAKRQIAVVGFVPNADTYGVLRDWSASAYVNLFPANSCSAAPSCITLREQSLDYGGYASYTYYWDGTTQGEAVINSNVRDYLVRRQLLCQEVGHNLKLGHGDGCMVQVADGRNHHPSYTNLNGAR